MDIDFLIDGILAIQAPDLTQEVAKAKTKYFIAATRFPETLPHWFSNTSTEPLSEQLRATKTASGVSAEFVSIDNIQYADGSFSISIQDCVSKARVEGAEKVILIDNATCGKISRPIRTLLEYRVRNAPAYVKAAVKSFCERIVHPLEQQPDLYICRGGNLPTRHPLVRKFCSNRATIEQGYADMARLDLTKSC